MRRLVTTDRRTPPRRALRVGLRFLEASLAIAGVACLLAWGFACARSSYTQSGHSAAFDAALRDRITALHREAPDRSEWSSARIAHYEEIPAAIREKIVAEAAQEQED